MLFSIITPCFNSVKTLERTYESLLRQGRSDFEWILVDDFSPDNGATTALIKRLQKNAPFKVTSIFLQKNYFGARSVYEGSLVALGDYICILDHDDQLMLGALDFVEKKLIECGDKYVAGICGRCVNEVGQFIGKPFKRPDFFANEGYVRFVLRNSSEFFQFTKASLIRECFARMEPGYTNGFVWAQISKKYKYLFSDTVLRIYDTGYAESYSNSKHMRVMYPKNKAEALTETLVAYKNFLVFNPLYSLRMAGSAVRHRLNAGESIFPARRLTGVVLLFYCAAIPFGFLKYLKNKIDHIN